MLLFSNLWIKGNLVLLWGWIFLVVVCSVVIDIVEVDVFVNFVWFCVFCNNVLVIVVNWLCWWWCKWLVLVVVNRILFILCVFNSWVRNVDWLGWNVDRILVIVICKFLIVCGFWWSVLSILISIICWLICVKWLWKNGVMMLCL